MKPHQLSARSLYTKADHSVRIKDQTRLPWEEIDLELKTAAEAVRAIKTMQVRGAPLIGITAAYGLALAMQEDSSDQALQEAVAVFIATRPTAVNLHHALWRLEALLKTLPPPQRAEAAYREASQMAEEDVRTNQAIGQHGLSLIKQHLPKERRINILTHCNAGRLACVDFGTALAPIYAAFDEKIDVHVYVDETRPRNQGAFLTAFELSRYGVPHTVITDNAGGHLMQQGLVDLVIVGADRVSANGDAANKIGTYLKALAAFDNQVPFFVAVPTTTIDPTLTDGIRQIPIEERSAEEVTHLTGPNDQGELTRIRVIAPESPAANPAFDVTPARLISGLITEKGIYPANSEAISRLLTSSAL